jgi:hypothetical protein
MQPDQARGAENWHADARFSIAEERAHPAAPITAQPI